MKDSRSCKFDRLKEHLVPVAILLAVTLAVYSPSLGHDFLLNWDDVKYVKGNEAVKGLTLAHVKTAFSTYYVGNFAPLHIISYMLDYSIWGMKAAGFILTNILLHALNGLLYYALLIRLTGRKSWAFLAGFIFLLHPVQVESVAWISQRKNVLAMFFFLISFLLYIRYREQGSGVRNAECGVRSAGGGTQNSKLKTQNLFYVGSIAAFICALLAKSVAVILPPILLLYDLVFVETRHRQRWVADKIPYIAAAGVIAVVAMKSQSPELGGGRAEFYGGGPLETFFTMLTVLARYLGLLFWPAHLSAVYHPPAKTGIDGQVLLAGLLLVLICIGGYCLYRRRKDLAFWGALFFIGLLPVSQIVPLVTLMNDRYLYFPMLGFAALVAGTAGYFLDRISSARQKTVTAVVCLVLLILPVLSLKRAEVWQDATTLWTDAFETDPNNVMACLLAGTAHDEAGNLDMALSFYHKALAVDPLHRETLQNISIFYLKAGKLDAGWPYLRKLVENHPKFAEGFVTLGNYHFETGDLARSEDSYGRALALAPGNGAILRNLGLVHFVKREFAQAREFYLKALQSGTDTAEVRFDLACIEAASGRKDDALRHLEAAFRHGFLNLDALSREPCLDSLRNAPEFQRLLELYFPGTR